MDREDSAMWTRLLIVNGMGCVRCDAKLIIRSAVQRYIESMKNKQKSSKLQFCSESPGGLSKSQMLQFGLPVQNFGRFAPRSTGQLDAQSHHITFVLPLFFSLNPFLFPLFVPHAFQREPVFLSLPLPGLMGLHELYYHRS